MDDFFVPFNVCATIFTILPSIICLIMKKKDASPKTRNVLFCIAHIICILALIIAIFVTKDYESGLFFDRTWLIALLSLCVFIPANIIILSVFTIVKIIKRIKNKKNKTDVNTPSDIEPLYCPYCTKLISDNAADFKDSNISYIICSGCGMEIDIKEQ